VTAEGVGSSGEQALNPVFYKGDNFGPHKKTPIDFDIRNI
jgi:hypothetical protein